MEEKEKTWSVKTIAEIAIFAALGYVLDMLAGIYSSPLFPNGGSLGIAMVCVFIISYRRGFLPGLITGLIMGLLDIADGIIRYWCGMVFGISSSRIRLLDCLSTCCSLWSFYSFHQKIRE